MTPDSNVLLLEWAYQYRLGHPFSLITVNSDMLHHHGSLFNWYIDRDQKWSLLGGASVQQDVINLDKQEARDAITEVLKTKAFKTFVDKGYELFDAHPQEPLCIGPISFKEIPFEEGLKLQRYKGMPAEVISALEESTNHELYEAIKLIRRLRPIRIQDVLP